MIMMWSVDLLACDGTIRHEETFLIMMDGWMDGLIETAIGTYYLVSRDNVFATLDNVE